MARWSAQTWHAGRPLRLRTPKRPGTDSPIFRLSFNSFKLKLLHIIERVRGTNE